MLQPGHGETARSCRESKFLVVRGKLNRSITALFTPKQGRREMERIERAQRCRKRLGGPGKYGRRHVNEKNSGEKVVRSRVQVTEYGWSKGVPHTQPIKRPKNFNFGQRARHGLGHDRRIELPGFIQQPA